MNIFSFISIDIYKINKQIKELFNSLMEHYLILVYQQSQYQLFAKAVVYLFEEELANQNSTNLLKLKPFPVRPTHSNYDNRKFS